MKKDFIVERQGRPFVMYAGLLNLAHENGLKSIRTDLIQAPSGENGYVAICAATVVLDKAGSEHIYTGIGDAAENNVGPAMRASLIRMAETRAKARALRDAVNVGVSAFEELNETDAPDNSPRAARNRSARQERPNVPGATAAGRQADTDFADGAELKPITQAQSNAISSMCKPRALDADQLARDKFNLETVSLLTAAQAADLIRTLSARTRPAAAHA